MKLCGRARKLAVRGSRVFKNLILFQNLLSFAGNNKIKEAAPRWGTNMFFTDVLDFGIFSNIKLKTFIFIISLGSPPF